MRMANTFGLVKDYFYRVDHPLTHLEDVRVSNDDIMECLKERKKVVVRSWVNCPITYCIEESPISSGRQRTLLIVQS